MSGGPSGPDWYLPRQDGPDARAIQGRNAFLKALGRLRPQSLTDLLDTVRPMAGPIPDYLLSRLAPLESASSNIAPLLEDLHEIPDSAVKGWSAAAEQVAEEIRRWGVRWNLRNPWLHDAALGAIQADGRGERGFEPSAFSSGMWPRANLPTPPGDLGAPLRPIIQRIQEADRTWSGVSPGEALMMLVQDNPPDTASEFQSWNPFSWESRAEAKSRIMRGVGAIVDQHLDSMEAWAEGIGAKPVPAKRNRGKRHYEWLVQFQVPSSRTRQPKTLKEIAEADAVALDTVQTAIRRTAEEIGLTRRSKFARRSEG